LNANNIDHIRLRVSHAYHTPMMNNVLEAYSEILSDVIFKPFNTRIFSTYTGGLVTPELFCSKQYWLDQIVNPVKFLDAVLQVPDYISNPTFIEVGPGNGLSSFIKKIFKQHASTVNLLQKSSGSIYEARALLCAKGLVFDLPEAHEGRRIPMPGYVFSKNYFWKPALNIHYNDFKEIGESYHYTSDQFKGDRIRTSVELKIADNSEIPDEVLDRLNELHTQYIQDIKNLFSSGDQRVHDRIEVLYEDTSFNKDEEDLPNVSSVFVKPTTDIEKSIAGFWGSVLGYQPVGILDNYFEVGGNSLLATKLMTRLSDEFDMELSFKELSECLNIQELAALVESKRRMMELVGDIEIENNNDDNYMEL